MHKATLTAISLALTSSAAIAAPWDVDMVDSDAYRGYECWEYTTDENGKRECVRSMAIIPEGVVSQKNLLTPNHIMTPDFPKGDNRWDAVVSPIETTDTTLATGKRMYDVYCSICHGKAMDDGNVPNLGTVAQPGRIAGIIPLTGEGGVLKNRTDGRVYSTIRKGAAIMPAYNWAMTDSEMWSIVHYVRTLDNAQYVPPAPANDEAADGGTQ